MLLCIAYHLYYKTVIIDMYFYYWWAIHLLDLATLYSSWMKNPDLCTCMEWHQSFQVLNQTASWMCANVTSWQFDHHGLFFFYIKNWYSQSFLILLDEILCVLNKHDSKYIVGKTNLITRNWQLIQNMSTPTLC